MVTSSQSPASLSGGMTTAAAQLFSSAYEEEKVATREKLAFGTYTPAKAKLESDYTPGPHIAWSTPLPLLGQAFDETQKQNCLVPGALQNLHGLDGENKYFHKMSRLLERNPSICHAS